MKLMTTTDRAGVKTCERKSAVAKLAGFCLLAAGLVATGCTAPAGITSTDIRDTAEFNRIVPTSDKPVLVEFSKEGCPPCAALEPTMDRLAGEYQGRATVAKAMVMHFTFNSPMPEIKDKYGIVFVPVVILFVKGKEVNRWFCDFDINHYRESMDQALAGTPVSRTPVKTASGCPSCAGGACYVGTK